MRSAASATYWQVSRTHTYSLTFALPLLLLYELLALAVNRGAQAGVRSAADMLLRRGFAVLGGRSEVAFVAVLIALAVVLVASEQRREPIKVVPRVYVAMLAESVLLAAAFGAVVSWVTAAVLSPLASGTLPEPSAVPLAVAAPASGVAIVHAAEGLSRGQALVVSLGAGLYEELVFRVLLVSGVAWLLGKALPGRRIVVAAASVVISALVFSAFHYVGPLGDAWSLQSFTFRFIGGIAFSSIFVLRGFGIVAWTHALYDVFLLVV